MNKLKYIFSAMLISASLGSIFTGCQDNEIYDVNSPADLDEQITQAAANIAERERLAAEAAAAQRNAVLAKLQDDVYQVGNTENGGAFWQTFSKSYTLDAIEDAFMIKFKNFTSGVNSYHNFGLVITNDVEHSFGDGKTYPVGAGYAEYVVLRADNFKNWAWGNENGTGWNTGKDSGKEQKARLNANYDASEAEDKKFSEQMEGADCEVFVGRAGDTLNIQYTIKTWAGETLTKKFFIKQEGVSNQAVRFFLITEKGHLVVYKASTTANETPKWSNEVIFTDEAKIDPRWKINELGAVGSLEIENYKNLITSLSEDEVADKTVDQIVKKYIFDKKTSVAKVVYKNTAEMVCEVSNLSFFSDDDFTTPGIKKIYASYVTSENGNEISVITSFEVEVVSFVSIKIDDLTLYLHENFGSVDVSRDLLSAVGIDPEGVETEFTVDMLNDIEFESVSSKAGEYQIEGDWKGMKSTFKITVVNPSQIFSNLGTFTSESFNTNLTGAVKIENNSYVKFTYKANSTGDGNAWFNPLYEFTTDRSQAKVTYFATLRTDPYGWADYYESAVGDENFNSLNIGDGNEFVAYGLVSNIEGTVKMQVLYVKDGKNSMVTYNLKNIGDNKDNCYLSIGVEKAKITFE